jgi:hypothetical protein
MENKETFFRFGSEYKLVHKECGSELIVHAATFDIAKETFFRFGIDINKYTMYLKLDIENDEIDKAIFGNQKYMEVSDAHEDEGKVVEV